MQASKSAEKQSVDSNTPAVKEMASTSSNGAASAAASGTGGGSAPTGFDTDPRVHFDLTSGKWTFEPDDGGSEMEWDVARAAWVPVLGEDLLTAQQAAYSVPGVDESTPAAPVQAREAKKRKGQSTEDGDPSSSKKAKRAEKPPTQPRNTAIYITHLPPSTTISQLSSVFSKAGLILEDADGEPRIKLYKDEEGKFKGEALVMYLKPESVDLAVRLMDETELVLGSGEGVMTVKKAEWEKKPPGGNGAGTGPTPAEGGATDGTGGDGKGKSDAQKKKTAKRAEKLLAKLTDWDSDEESTAEIAARARNSRIVVLERMFTLDELEEDPTLLLDLKEDVRSECETLGEVTNVTLYDGEPDGIMVVRFKDDLAAQACIAKMNGRFFAGRSISAYVSEGKKYKQSGKGPSLAGTGLGGDGGADDAEKEKERLDAYAAWLEKDEDQQ